MTWVLGNLKVALDAAGIEEKRIKGLIEIALLIAKEEAEIVRLEK